MSTQLTPPLVPSLRTGKPIGRPTAASARRERDELHFLLGLVKAEPATLRRSKLLVVNNGPSAVLRHREAKLRIALDPDDAAYTAEGLLRARDGADETVCISADLRDDSLPSGYFDVVFLNFRVAHMAEARAFIAAALRVGVPGGRIGVNLTLSDQQGRGDAELLLLLRDYSHSLQLISVEGRQTLRGLIRAGKPAGEIKLSVLLNSYNQRPFIAQALDSILMQQTAFKFDIVVLDDGSTDGTRDVILQYAAQYPDKFRLALNETNLGLVDPAALVQSWWELMCRADGQYLALLEGDDYWTSAVKLQRQVDFMDQNPEFVLCGHENDIVNEWTKTKTKGNRFPTDFTLSMAQLLEGNMFHTSSLLYRNGVGEWPRRFADLEFSDWPLQIMLAEHGGVRMFADSMSAYRIHRGGVWAGKYRLPSDQDVPDTTAEGWRLIIDFWKGINGHLDYRYDDLIRTLVARKEEEISRMQSPTLR